MRRVRMALGRAVRFADGAPDVTGLPCDLIATDDAGEYMRRYHLEFGGERAVRLHHILASDPGVLLHDHPWDYVTMLLDGSYTEITPGGRVRYDAPCVLTRRAEQLHRLELDAPVWTYFVTGRVRRKWGFATPRGWVPHDRHPGNGTMIDCDPPAPRARREW